ncbi:NRDE protein-domain-containing protein [Phlyctochytrium arcticum]|nr:NRDE protein-domain-containing protein [Phlyctochytrium arcticum]
MCVIYFVTNTPQYKLVVAGNRDEFLARPTASAHFWTEIGREDVLAGTDLKVSAEEHDHPHAGQKMSGPNGTWMGLNVATGNYALLTNIREPPSKIPDKLSRGCLVRDFLLESVSSEEYARDITQKSASFDGFNLFVGNVNSDCLYCTNKTYPETLPITVTPSVVHGISNGVYVDGSSDWPKVERGKGLMQEAINGSSDKAALIESLLHVLNDKDVPHPSQLPANAHDPELEYTLSSICIDRESAGNVYGTRTHTIILVDHQGNGTFVEVNRYSASEGAVQEGPARSEIQFTIPLRSQ